MQTAGKPFIALTPFLFRETVAIIILLHHNILFLPIPHGRIFLLRQRSARARKRSRRPRSLEGRLKIFEAFPGPPIRISGCPSRKPLVGCNWRHCQRPRGLRSSCGRRELVLPFPSVLDVIRRCDKSSVLDVLPMCSRLSYTEYAAATITPRQREPLRDHQTRASRRRSRNGDRCRRRQGADPENAKERGSDGDRPQNVNHAASGSGPWRGPIRMVNV